VTLWPASGVRARYRAERQEIAARYAEWEITGSAEVRDVDPDARAFTPHASFKLMMAAELRRDGERPPDLQPAVDAVEQFPARGLSPALRHLLRQASEVRRDERRGAVVRWGPSVRGIATNNPRWSGSVLVQNSSFGQQHRLAGGAQLEL
jgi:hypothetical protein